MRKYNCIGCILTLRTTVVKNVGIGNLMPRPNFPLLDQQVGSQSWNAASMRDTNYAQVEFVHQPEATKVP